MRDANRWVGSGRLVRDPEGTQFEKGNQRAKFTLAVNRGKDQGGKDKGAYFVNCQAFGSCANAMLRYGRKGRRIFVVDSSLFISRYDKDGEPRTFAGLNVRGILFMDDGSNAGRSQETEPDDPGDVPE